MPVHGWMNEFVGVVLGSAYSDSYFQSGIWVLISSRIDRNGGLGLGFRRCPIHFNNKRIGFLCGVAFFGLLFFAGSLLAMGTP